MAIGNPGDQLRRLKALVPKRWFGDTSPLLNAVLGGIAAVMARAYGQLTYVTAQTRIATASDQWLDAIGSDFLGNALPRRVSEPDAAYRPRIERELFRERATRHGLIAAVTDFTGLPPSVFEPWNVRDAGAYRGPVLGYGVAGAYGSLAVPNEAFLTVYRSVNALVPPFAGWRVSTGGWGRGTIGYATLSQVGVLVSDADIMSCVDRNRPAGIKVVLTIQNMTNASTGTLASDAGPVTFDLNPFTLSTGPIVLA